MPRNCRDVIYCMFKQVTVTSLRYYYRSDANSMYNVYVSDLNLKITRTFGTIYNTKEGYKQLIC